MELSKYLRQALIKISLLCLIFKHWIKLWQIPFTKIKETLTKEHH